MSSSKDGQESRVQDGGRRREKREHVEERNIRMFPKGDYYIIYVFIDVIKTFK